jgi:hypothetical protein
MDGRTDRPGPKEEDFRMILCSICALYGSKQHVIISYSTTKRNDGFGGEEKFRLINFIAGRLCVYRHIWWILFSLFSIIIIHYIPSARFHHLVNLFMI